jgi:hypothetical protein
LIVLCVQKQKYSVVKEGLGTFKAFKRDIGTGNPMAIVVAILIADVYYGSMSPSSQKWLYCDCDQWRNHRHLFRTPPNGQTWGNDWRLIRSPWCKNDEMIYHGWDDN